MPVVSISLTNDLLRKLDSLTKERGFSSRSEAVRDAIRSAVEEHKLNKMETGSVFSTITAVYEYGQRDVEEQLMNLRHKYDETISTNLHIHLGRRFCVEVFVVSGNLEEVMMAVDRIRATRGIYQVKYTLVPMEQRGT